MSFWYQGVILRVTPRPKDSTRKLADSCAHIVPEISIHLCLWTWAVRLHTSYRIFLTHDKDFTLTALCQIFCFSTLWDFCLLFLWTLYCNKLSILCSAFGSVCVTIRNYYILVFVCGWILISIVHYQLPTNTLINTRSTLCAWQLILF